MRRKAAAHRPIYCVFAGLEPLAFPELVLFDDPARSSVPIHPARRQHVVIIGSVSRSGKGES